MAYIGSASRVNNSAHHVEVCFYWHWILLLFKKWLSFSLCHSTFANL